MVFQSSANDLPLVIQILRPYEADDAVNEKRLEGARDSIGSRFKRKLIDSVMRFGGKSAALAGFEIHHVVTHPTGFRVGVATVVSMMFENLFVSIAQQVQCDSEAAICGFRSGHGLEEKIDRRSTIKRRQLSGDMRQATGLRGDFIGIHEAIQGRKNRADGIDRVSRRIYTNDGVSTTV